MKKLGTVTLLLLCQFFLSAGLSFGDHYEEIFAKLREDTQHIKDVSGLVVNGYHTKGETLPCKHHETMGAMGYHFRKDWKMDKTFDPTEPEEPIIDTNGNLVGAEYVVYGDKAAVEMLNYFHVAHTNGPGEGDVKIVGQKHMGGGHGSSGQSSFEYKGKGKYEFHAWAWLKNPNGHFAHFNPSVSCQNAKCREVVHKDGSKTLEGECSQLR